MTDIDLVKKIRRNKYQFDDVNEGTTYSRFRASVTSLGIMSPSYPCSINELSAGEGHVEVCLRQIYMDLIDFGLRWIRLESFGVRGIWSIYMLFFRPSSLRRPRASSGLYR